MVAKGSRLSAETIKKRNESLAKNKTRHKKPVVINGAIHWICSTCNIAKLSSEFYGHKKSPNGLKAQCKGCHSRSAIESRDIEKHRCRNRTAQRKRDKALKAYAPIAKEDLEKISQILGQQCLSCGTRDLVGWDHIIPISRFGPHCLSNLQPLCRKCNEKKGSQSKDYRSSKQVEMIQAEWQPPAQTVEVAA